MNNDRELLELAAKAAGIDARRLPDAWPNRFDDDLWNPLIDDGDALRLAVKLELTQSYSHGNRNFIDVWRYSDEYTEVGNIHEELGDDPYAATRRAIVRAAAEIGKEQK